MTAQLPSKIRLAQIASFTKSMALPPSHDEIEALAHFALAAHEQEPVAYMCDGDDGREYNGHNEFYCGGRGIPLYTHPAPVPAVPDEVLSRLEHEANHITAWHHIDEHSCKVSRRDLITLVSACRAAMLNGGKS